MRLKVILISCSLATLTYLITPKLSPYVFNDYFLHQSCEDSLSKKSESNLFVLSSSPLLAAIDHDFFKRSFSCGGLRLGIHEFPAMLKKVIAKKKIKKLILGLSHQERMAPRYHDYSRLFYQATPIKDYMEYYLKFQMNHDFSKQSFNRYFLFFSYFVRSPFNLLYYVKSINLQRKDDAKFLFEYTRTRKGQFNAFKYFTQELKQIKNKIPTDDTYLAKRAGLLPIYANQKIYLHYLKETFEVIRNNSLKSVVVIPAISNIVEKTILTEELIEKVEGLVKQYPNIEFIRTKNEYPGQLFYDAVHLNRLGAQIFSHNFSKILKKMNFLNSKEILTPLKLSEQFTLPLKSNTPPFTVTKFKVFCPARGGECRDKLRVDTKGDFFIEIGSKYDDKVKYKNLKDFLKRRGVPFELNEKSKESFEIIYPYASFYPTFQFDGLDTTYTALYYSIQLNLFKKGRYLCTKSENIFIARCFELIEFKDHIFSIYEGSEDIHNIYRKVLK